MTTSASFVRDLASIKLSGVFNPYADTCDVHDRSDAAVLRQRALRSYLEAVRAMRVDTIWMGRDLGYRGGRRTGLALTDELHLTVFASVYPGSATTKSTRGPIVAERTAAEIWSMLGQLKSPPLLWNVFPFHPHEFDDPFTNRKFTASELKAVDPLNRLLVKWLGIRRVIAIGQDAADYASDLGVDVQTVRHPSYGGIMDFRNGIHKLYGLHSSPLRSTHQSSLL